jgi:hypothetical protein
VKVLGLKTDFVSNFPRQNTVVVIFSNFVSKLTRAKPNLRKKHEHSSVTDLGTEFERGERRGFVHEAEVFPRKRGQDLNSREILYTVELNAF